MLVGVMYGPQAALFSETFPTEIRYSGTSVSYQLGAILGGGFAPLIATMLMARFHGTFALSMYMAIVCAITAASVAALRGSRDHERS
jgi:MFS family permease